MIRFRSDDEVEVYMFSKTVTLDGCWLWGGFIDPQGYGRFGCFGKLKLAHRVMYELRSGEIPAGLTLDHLCRRRDCINPEHLEPVTQAENTRRGFGPSGLNARKMSCPCGEPYSIISGNRRCRTCTTRYQAEYCKKHKDKRNAMARARYAKKLNPVRGDGMDYSAPFLAFWNAYKCKRRVKKMSAWLAWQKLGCEPMAGDVMRGLESFKKTEQWASGYMPEPERWILHRRWEDEPSEQDDTAGPGGEGWDVTGAPK